MKPAEAYILNQPEPYKTILLHLQVIIESAYPKADLQFKWHIPFYYLDGKPLCYINVSTKKEYVDLAFWVPFKLTNYQELLVVENRKVVKSLRYKTADAINNTVITSILKEITAKERKGFYQQKKT